jgi:hypothetical protein
MNDSAELFSDRPHNLRMAAGPAAPLVAAGAYSLSFAPFLVGVALLACTVILAGITMAFYVRSEARIDSGSITVRNPLTSYAITRDELVGYRMRVRVQPARVVLLTARNPRGRTAIALPAKQAIELFHALGIPHTPKR